MSTQPLSERSPLVGWGAPGDDPINSPGSAHRKGGKEGSGIKVLLYFIFLAIYTTTIVLSRDKQAFLFSDLVEDAFEIDAGSSVSDPDQRDGAGALFLYEFLSEEAIPRLYKEPAFAVDPANEPVAVFDETNLLVQRKLRLRQLRVRPEKCRVRLAPEDGPNALRCYAPFSSATETKNTFVYSDTLDPLSYETDTKSSGLKGNVASYPASGYVLELGDTAEEALAQLDEIFESSLDEDAPYDAPRYVDGGTRAVFVEFSLYGLNSNSLLFAQFLFEFAPTSSVITMQRIRTANMFIYDDPVDGTALLVLEIIVLVFVFYFVVEEIHEVTVMRGDYFSSAWNVIDMANLALFAVIIGLRAHSIELGKNYDPLSQNISVELIELLEAEGVVQSIQVLLMYIKVLKFFAPLYGGIRVMTRTLTGAAAGSISFTFVLAIFIVGSGVCFHTAFGSNSADFKSLDESIFSLFRYTLGDFDLEGLGEASPILGPIYGGLFLTIVFLILVNVFISVIGNAFEAALDSVGEHDNLFEQSKKYFLAAIGRGHRY